MTAQIQQELNSRGVAQVIVMLKPGLASAAGAAAPALTGAAGAVGAAASAAAGALAAGARAARAAGGPLAALNALARHFVASERSQRTALLDAAVAQPQLFDLTRASVRAVGGRARTAAGAAARAGGVPTYASGDATLPVRVFPNLGVMLGTVDRQGLAALERDPQVDDVVGAPPLSLIRPVRIGPGGRAAAGAAAARRTGGTTWGISAMRVPELWKKGLDGQGVLVGHLDTGADGRHPTLRRAISAFAEFDFLGRRRDRSPYDSDDHGTHTAATIAGRRANNRSVGVAPGASLASAVVIEGGEVIARVLGGMDWALGQQVKILNMSLGFRGWWEDFLPLTQLLRERGVLPVFAVGNEGPGTSRSPGNYVEALAVGAHDTRKYVPRFSSSQRFSRAQDAVVPDLVAPGVAIISAMPGGGYQEMDGTSMATPHVAGFAALLWQAVPSATVNDIESAIFGSCTRPASMTSGRGNRGIPNAVKALTLLTGVPLGGGSGGGAGRGRGGGGSSGGGGAGRAAKRGRSTRKRGRG